MARVLVIDDEPALRTILRLWIEEEGHEVVEADSGELGILLFDRQRFGLVITDLFMPGMDGLEVTMKIREMSGDCPIITACGSCDDFALDLVHIARSLGATATLSKPFGRDQLRGVLRTALNPK